MDFVIPGEVPSKKNSRIFNTHTKKSFPNPRYTQWKEEVVVLVRMQAKGYKAPVPCRVNVKFWHGDMRSRDGDNSLSSLFDMLKDAGIIKDDKWQFVPSAHFENELDRGHARCEFSIEPMEESHGN